MSKFTRKKALTLPTLKMVIDTPIYVKINDIKHKESLDEKTGKIKVNKDTGEPELLPVASVVNLETGELNELVMGSVLIKNIQEAFPTESDVFGKCFEITKHNKKTGKRYHTYTIFEIEENEVA